MNPTTVVPAQIFLHHLLENGLLEVLSRLQTPKDSRNRPYVIHTTKLETEIYLRILAESYFAQYPADTFDVVFGPSSLSMSFARAISETSGRHIDYAYEKAGHVIGGKKLEKKRILIIENPPVLCPIPTKSFKFVQKNGGEPVYCLIPFDFQERGETEGASPVQQFEEATGISVRAGSTFSDLIGLLQSVPPESRDDTTGEFLERLRTYKERYSV